MVVYDPREGRALLKHLKAAVLKAAQQALAPQKADVRDLLPSDLGFSGDEWSVSITSTGWLHS